MRFKAMPPFVADPYPWHLSAAAICVGQASNPGLLNGSCGQVPLAAGLRPAGALFMACPKRRTRETGLAPVPPVSFVRRDSPSPRSPGPRHNLGTILLFGASAPGPSPPKTGAPTPVRGSRLSFEWIVPGLTAVSFWTARRRLIAALEGPVRLRLHTGPIESE